MSEIIGVHADFSVFEVYSSNLDSTLPRLINRCFSIFYITRCSIRQDNQNPILLRPLQELLRCDPDIIGFCNEEFYNRQLVIYTARKEHEKTMRIIHTAPGNFARKNPEGTGLYNQREIDEIQRLLKENG